MEAEILTLSEMADLLRVPKATMYKLVQLGRVPGFKVGKHWRFLRRDVEGWLAAHSAATAAVSPAKPAEQNHLRQDDEHSGAITQARRASWQRAPI